MALKVVNLDAYKKHRTFILDGVSYKTKGMTVGMFLENDVLAKIQSGSFETKEAVAEMVKTLLEITDVPRETLLAQDFETLGRIMAIAQGVDLLPPEAEENESGQGEPEKNESPVT